MPKKHIESTIVPIPQPKPVVEQGRPWFRSRRFSFVMADWQAFDRAMGVACPYVQYIRDWGHEEGSATVPPPVRATRNICEQADGESGLPRVVLMLFDPDWRLEFVPPGILPPWWPFDLPNESWTIKYRQPLPRARITLPCPYRPATDNAPEHIHSGSQIDFAIEPGNEGHIAFMKRFWSLFGKLASNRHQSRVAYPSYESYGAKVTTDLWLGREAIRWALEDPKRILDYVRHTSTDEPQAGSGTRPIAEKWRDRLGLPHTQRPGG